MIPSPVLSVDVLRLSEVQNKDYSMSIGLLFDLSVSGS